MKAGGYVREAPGIDKRSQIPPPHPLHSQDCLFSKDNLSHYTTFQDLQEENESVRVAMQSKDCVKLLFNLAVRTH